MQKRRLVVLFASLWIGQLIAPPPAQSQYPLTVGCLIPGVGWTTCTGLVALGVAGGIAWYQVNYGGRWFKLPANNINLRTRYPTPQPGPPPVNPREMRSQGNYNVPGQQEVHWVQSEASCRQLFRQLRGQGERLNNYEFRASSSGKNRGGYCVLFGPDATDNRFIDNRYNSRDEYR